MKLYPAHDDDEFDGSVYGVIGRLVGPQRRVVDFGCSRGDLARLLTRQGCTVFGVDINAEALEEAKKFCSGVRVANLDVVTPRKAVGGKRFDVAIFADVLEHLRDPWGVLRRAHEVLEEDGFVVASIPNIAHGAVILGLIEGRFEYAPLGILDDTHLRFFTRATALELFRRSGFTVTGAERTVVPMFGESELVPVIDPGTVASGLIEELRSRRDAETLQFVIRGHRRAEDAPAAEFPVELENPEATVKALSAQIDVLNATLIRERAAAEAARTTALAAAESARRDGVALAEASAAQRLADAQKAFAEQLAAGQADAARQLARKDADLHTWLAEKDADVQQLIAAKDADMQRQLAANDADLRQQLAAKDADVAAWLAEKDASFAAEVVARDARHASELAARHAAHAEALLARDARHKSDRAARNAEHSETLRARDVLGAAAMDELKASHDRVIASLKAEHQSALDEAATAHAAALENNQRASARELASLRSALEQQVEVIRRQARDEVDRLRRAYEERAAEQTAVLIRRDAVLQSMSSTTTLLREELTALRKQLSTRGSRSTRGA